ncbi:hypothetical protein [Gloeothece verrucosa]|uniref:Uncharacterized protein n=1 Tax=Gloeothece verrucosa (strain PCC 7822) TaxID=497965 RepID=E0UFE3_GLOV7|nr:hypothetical protein [Gloeothece verrucosa]ADN16637.1 hypothetical protein Cyan7822_4733 [Gloeothece verrucosa PCC 7822]
MNSQAQTKQQSNNTSIVPAVNLSNTPMNTTQTNPNQTNQQSNTVSVASAATPNPITPVPSQVAGSDGFFLLMFPLVLAVFYALLNQKK